jgi:hypothetical protein
VCVCVCVCVCVVALSKAVDELLKLHNFVSFIDVARQLVSVHGIATPDSKVFNHSAHTHNWPNKNYACLCGRHRATTCTCARRQCSSVTAQPTSMKQGACELASDVLRCCAVLCCAARFFVARVIHVTSLSFLVGAPAPDATASASSNVLIPADRIS